MEEIKITAAKRANLSKAASERLRVEEKDLPSKQETVGRVAIVCV